MPVNLRQHGNPFERLVVPYGDIGGKREVARYRCQNCQSELDIPIVTGHGLSTDEHRKRITTRGWTASSRLGVVTCPDCLGAKEKQMPPAQSRPTLVQPTFQETPNADQRLAIRHALDTNFDDKVGVYLGGQSDQGIADHLNIPWAWVAGIRDAAYGPIRITPEIQELRRDLDAARLLVGGIEERLREIETGKSIKPR